MAIKRSDIPNLLSISRIVLIPFMIWLFFIPEAWASWTILAIYTPAAISDFLDGYLARSMNTSSMAGKFLDPISDKLLVCSLLFMFPASGRLEGLWVLPALIILMRELFISGLREFLGPMNVQVPVSKLAKWKTTAQMFALGFVIMGPYAPPSIPSQDIGHVLLVLAMVLAVITACDYFKVAKPYLRR